MPEKKFEDKAKKAAGDKAAELIENGMTVGLGTGSTVAYFIERLVVRCQNGLKIKVVPTSLKSADLAKKGGIPLLSTAIKLDIAVDGADEIDPEKRMIKGGGGALLREKIVAGMAEQMVVIVDEKKYVPLLGHFPLPVEIAPFCFTATLEHLTPYHPVLRKSNNNPFITDNGNYIADLHLSWPVLSLEDLDIALKKIPGILETGLFLNFAKTVIVGHPDGSTTTLK